MIDLIKYYSPTELFYGLVSELDPQTSEKAAWCRELPGCVTAGETQQKAGREKQIVFLD